jgi:hypothetical protein
MTPARPALVLQILGLIFGLTFAIVVRPASPEINYGLPGFLFLNWALTQAMTFAAFYAIIRQMVMVNRVIKQIKKMDISNINPLYGLARLAASIAIAIVVIAVSNYLTRIPQHIVSTIAVIFYASFSALALAVFVLPLTGINRRLRHEKDRLLITVNVHIQDAFDKVRE